MAERETLRLNYKNAGDIPFVIFKSECGNKRGRFAFHNGKLYEVTIDILCGEYYNSQPDCWWEDGHNIELQEAI